MMRMLAGLPAFTGDTADQPYALELMACRTGTDSG
jgi:hypothetical protein